MAWCSCKDTCAGSDPVSDTVKVDPAAFAGKENTPPVQVPNSAKELGQEKEEQKRKQELLRQKEEKEAEELRQAEDEARRQRELEERKAERQRQEERRRQEEQAAREQQAAEAICAKESAERSAAEREEAAAREAAAREEKQRQDQEAAAQKAEAQRLQAERAAAQVTVNAWCKSNGFADLNAKKKSFISGTRFPLHEAVSKKNEEMVTLMVRAGVDKSLKNSKGQTAEELARKMNKSGSMDNILVKLS